ncbi:MAG: arylamine N-acetyltransferase [Desulforegulaceae bacterium]|nr:arylamine N-acetyltransferase [Desulforegulaceae bacterium]
MHRTEMVNKYLKILNLDNRELDFDFLCQLVSRHLATFAFSSVGCLLGHDLPLDFDSLFSRILVNRRGGYCFEHNGFFYEILEELGFSPELYLARVIYGQDTHPGLTHRLSIVKCQGQSYVLDVGFGPYCPRVPVPMSGAETNDGHKVFRIHEKRQGEYHIQVLKDNDFFSLYRFELARYGQSDCEIGHFYSHRHPDAPLVNLLVASRVLGNETRLLNNLEYSVSRGNKKETIQVSSSQQLIQILTKELDIQITDEEGRQLYQGLSAKKTKLF